MPRVTIEWKGIEKAFSKLVNAPGNVDRLIDAVVKNNAEKAKAEAQRIAPYDTGFLHDEIYAHYPGKACAEIVSNAGYSGFLEYGTRKMSAQPFLRPAIESILPDLEKDYNSVIRRAFK
ncbi:phage protein, HK97 gp10 family [Streptococcus dysgalactiae subsp. dysgalactiae]|uniref:HK97-gp10 family putative phage morphogenesis protein n=1 Tax=Streptococcus dysgalactiae TaxID=1334 RepID=UPI000F6F5D24|nr:HK97-gp10 family putative phage morphogenesis protein [Streptococcus dysgalactiae]VDZ39826.1 phage protein, HK97 gp10 family [Streptococcus dysgalactiae subsp. dysgalactiae]HEL1011795.1 HK97 gp10 family phage protein [Streptococcus equi subsp. ruminatorum]